MTSWLDNLAEMSLRAAGLEKSNEQHSSTQRTTDASKLARVRDLHYRYSPASVDFDCCGGCNALTNGYVPWPCPTAAAIEDAE